MQLWGAILLPFPVYGEGLGFVEVVPNRDAGEFFWWCGSSPPSYALECDGSAVDRTTYAALFAVVSTTFGSTSASTFNLPNLVTDNRFIRAADGVTITVGLTQSDGAPALTGTLSVGTGSRFTAGTGAFAISNASTQAAAAGTNSGSLTGTFQSSNSNATYGGGVTEVRPNNIGLLPCIVF